MVGGAGSDLERECECTVGMLCICVCVCICGFPIEEHHKVHVASRRQSTLPINMSISLCDDIMFSFFFCRYQTWIRMNSLRLAVLDIGCFLYARSGLLLHSSSQPAFISRLSSPPFSSLHFQLYFHQHCRN